MSSVQESNQYLPWYALSLNKPAALDTSTLMSLETGSIASSATPNYDATKLWKVLRQAQRQESFSSGTNALLNVAAHATDDVFLYPLLDEQSSDLSDANLKKEDFTARVVTLQIRQRAAEALRGVLATGAHAAALLPAQSLPLFIPQLFDIGQKRQPAVAHVGCESIRNDLAVGGSYESIYALQHSGAILLNSATPQEMHDMAVVAQMAARKLSTLAVHFYDSSRIARELSPMQTLSAKSVFDIASAVSNTAIKNTTAPVTAEQVQSVMDDLFHALHKQYKVYDYFGAPDAETVIVVMGEATGAVRQAVNYEQMLGGKVGVVQVRLLLPWSHSLFADAMPSTAKRVAVLENLPPGALAFQNGLLSQHVQVFFHSNHWEQTNSPTVVTGVYGGVFRQCSFTSGMARRVLRYVQDQQSRRPFVVAQTESHLDATLQALTDGSKNVNAMEVIYGDELELTNSEAYGKQFLLYGFDDPDAQNDQRKSLLSTFESTLQLLNGNQSTQVNALVSHSTPFSADGSVQRPVSCLEARLSPRSVDDSALHQTVEEADVVFVSRSEIIEEFDVVSSVKQGGKLLVNAEWNTIDDLPDVDAFKFALAQKDVQLLVIDLSDVQGRVEEDDVACFAAQIAFLKATSLYSEEVVLALLQKQVAPMMHATLRQFVSSVWSEMHSITYPASEWKSMSETSDSSEDGTEELEVEKSLEKLSALQRSKVAHSVASARVNGSKRSRRNISNHTKTAWRMLFPDEYDTTQAVRDHVTDLVTVSKWERLTPDDYDRNVFHVEMDTTNTAISYRIGEALAVFAHNDEAEVLEFLRSYNVDPDELVSLPVTSKDKSKPAKEETLSYFQLFSHVLDVFGRPSKKFYQALADRATDSKQKEKLLFLLDAEGKEEYKRRVDETTTYAELLEEFTSARPTMEDLVHLVPRIKPRHYSIASSMRMNPKSVHLLIVVHDWTTPSGKYRIGQATNFLSAIQPGQKLSVSVTSSVMKLPVNPEDPIVMAGLGTGMAPFRAFIQERAFLRSQGVKVGPIALYFGSRYKSKEFLYGDELEEYVRQGLVTHLRCAFSRDQENKVYIQDRIAEDKTLLADWMLHRNAHFYLCGPTWPVADVREALVSSFTEEAGMDRKQANATIERMREEGRYVLEVY